MPSAWDVFKESLKQLPEVMKWALAVAGIVALIAIIRGMIADPRIAVYGPVIMLVLMAVLVIFSKIQSTPDSAFYAPVLVFMWTALVLILLTATLLFTSAFFQWPINFTSGEGLIRDGAVYTPTVGDKRVWDLQEQVNALRGSWETVAQYGDVKRIEVLERATKLANALLAVDDASLGPSGHVIKREFSCYALIMVASSENDVKRKEQFAERAIAQCESAVSALTSIRSAKNPDANLKYTAAWIRDTDEEPFTNYLLAMATCLKGGATGDRAKKLEAMDILERVPSFYLNKYPPDRDYTLKVCSEEKKEITHG